MSNERDEFDLAFRGESGLMDNVDVQLCNFRFGRNPAFARDGELPVIAMVDLVDIAGIEETRENQFYTIGNGWEPVDAQGTAVTHPKAVGFNQSSNLQKFLTRCLDADLEKIQGHFEQTGLKPQQAAFWEGLCVHLDLEKQKIEFGERKGETRDVLVPTAVLGWNLLNGSAPAKAATPAKKTAKKASASKKAAAKPEPEVTEEPASGLTDDVAAAIRAIADECDTHEEMVDRAYAEIDGIDSDAAIQEAIEDSGPESIWQAAVDAAG